MNTTHVQAHLIAAGLMDEDRVTRRPRPGTCRHCRHAVTAAITDSGFTILCWPTPTTTLGELVALTNGLTTYTQLDDELLYRDDFRIRGHNADHTRVLVRHQCGDTPPPPNPLHQAARARRDLPAAPPF